MSALEEYILAFESILYGLIVSRILISWNKMLQEKESFKHYWAHYILTFSIFLFIVFIYIYNAITDQFAGIEHWMPFLTHAVLPPAIFTFISYQMFPKKLNGVNLKQFVMDNRWKIFLPAFAFGVYYSFYMLHREGLSSTIYIAFIFLTLGISAIASKKSWLIETTIMFLFLFVAYLYVMPYLSGNSGHGDHP